MSQKDPRIEIDIGGGVRANAAAPVVISASRVTDIPSFHGRWLIRRLREGWCSRPNPFTGRPCFISFANCRAIVFWTKDPAPMLPLLQEIDAMGFNYYFLFTLNDYEGTGLEPRLRPFKERAAAFRRLSEKLGPMRVAWRFDPLILAPGIGVPGLVERVRAAGEAIFGCARTLIVSFADVRSCLKARRSLAASGLFCRPEEAELSRAQMLEAAAGLARVRDGWARRGWDLEIQSCAEEICLDGFGIRHGACIDADLMRRLWPSDARLMHFLNTGRVLGGAQGRARGPASPPDLKDPSQRKLCCCIRSRDVGAPSTCPHLCAYCYANGPAAEVAALFKAQSLGSPSLGGGFAAKACKHRFEI
ncbi:MAG: DUF1848 domain-containing protein [Succinivibrio sp.]